MDEGFVVSTNMDKDDMSNVAFDQSAQRWATMLEKNEAARSRATVLEARPVVARRIGVAPGALERIRAGRMKGIRTWLFQRIRALVIAELQAEILRLEHELFLARTCGSGAGDDDILAASAAVETAKGILREAAK
jgi:hypothetical protein